jgi:hypothetical protein
VHEVNAGNSRAHAKVIIAEPMLDFHGNLVIMKFGWFLGLKRGQGQHREGNLLLLKRVHMVFSIGLS